MFQSTRPARRATSESLRTLDTCRTSFNPRVPRGRDICTDGNHRWFIVFQSTRPARARPRYSVLSGAAGCFNPRAPRGGATANRRRIRAYASAMFQSTRPARARRDLPSAGGQDVVFQSTRPARGATIADRSASERSVSIHAPARGATALTISQYCDQSFNPRAPRGARRERRHAIRCITFQSTRPARGATCDRVATGPYDVSIHAPRAGRDCR